MGKNMNDNKSGAVMMSAGLYGLLAIALIALKLLRVITWDWIWVLSPFWIPWVLEFFGIVIMIIACAFIDVLNSRNKK